MVYVKVASDDYLEHYGIKGQRWGVRRYQNEDGSLTRAGRKRYSSKTVGSDKDYPSKEEMQRVIKEEKIKKQYDEVVKSRNTKIDDTTNAIRTVNNNLNSLENIYRSRKTKNPEPKIDVSNMTNKELQDAITRMNLEDNYVRLMRSRQPQVQQGKDAVEKTLAVLKTGGELAVSALTIYSLIEKLEHAV